MTIQVNLSGIYHKWLLTCLGLIELEVLKSLVAR